MAARRRDEIRSAYSFCSASDLRAHFGLGPATQASQVVIRWPSGHLDRFNDVAADRQYIITEGGGIHEGLF